MHTARRDSFYVYAITWLLTLFMMGVVLVSGHFTPFGPNTLAVYDGWIQYLDFFAYFRDILTGNNNLEFTFSQGLGDSGVGTFAYFLASPFNLLVIFFPKSSLNSFFSLIVTLKIATCGLTCAVYLRHCYEKLEPSYCIMLSLSYALMQYSVAQWSNIMWLDGVYMLPLVLLGVHLLVREKRLLPLVFSVACSVLFNWYSAGINCLFSGLYLLFAMSQEGVYADVKRAVVAFGRYLAAMLLGLGLSSFLFYPAGRILLAGGRGESEWDYFNWDFLGNPFGVIQYFTLGAQSSLGNVSLYCGSVAVVACTAFFYSKDRNTKKLACGLFLAMTALLFYWQPLVFSFSLFHSVGSYWYRYSYVGVLAIIVVAAHFFAAASQKPGDAYKTAIVKGGVLLSILLLLLDYMHRVFPLGQTYLTVLFYLVTALLLAALGRFQQTDRLSRFFSPRKLVQVALLAVLACDLGMNAYVFLRPVRGEGLPAIFKSYVKQQSAQISSLQSRDPSFYRMTQTSTRTDTTTGLTAIYNEPLTFNYSGLTAYTSSANRGNLSFMGKLGYFMNFGSMNIVNTSILPADSLLGVKYVLSRTPFQGLEPVPDIPSANGKIAYYNPYHLPPAFVYPESSLPDDSEERNPFLFQNMLYSRLLGHPVEIFRKAQVVENRTEKEAAFAIAVPQDALGLYGYVDTAENINASLYVDDAFLTAYSRWLAPRVVYLPVSAGKTQAKLTLKAEKSTQAITGYAFYYLDRKVFEESVSKIRSRQGSLLSYSFKNGLVKASVQAGKNDRLFLSVPYTPGWYITNNGKEVPYALLGGSLMTISLDEGLNQIELWYRLPGKRLGIALSVFSLLVVIFLFMRSGRQRILF